MNVMFAAGTGHGVSVVALALVVTLIAVATKARAALLSASREETLSEKIADKASPSISSLKSAT